MKNKFIAGAAVLSLGVAALLLQPSAFAKLEWCGYESEVGDECKVHYEDLRPTQFAVGKREARKRAKRIEDEDEAGTLKEYLKDHIIPVVVRNDRMYILDHHHLLYALYISDVDRSKVYAKVVANWSDISEGEFWKKMAAKNYFRDEDENGKAGNLPTTLPKSIEDMKDDPFRSLAYEVREEGGYKKTKVLYAEFIWADFFRKHITKAELRSNFDKAVTKALKLAHSDAARGLPGYSKRSCSDELM